MNEVPMLARAMLGIARFLMPPNHDQWFEAMLGDVEDAREHGSATRWAFGCLMATLQLRIRQPGATTFARASILAALGVVFVSLAIALGIPSGRHPRSGVPIVLIVVALATFVICAVGFWKADRLTRPENRRKIAWFSLVFGVLLLPQFVLNFWFDHTWESGLMVFVTATMCINMLRLLRARA